jgi:hypothetical protein
MVGGVCPMTGCVTVAAAFRRTSSIASKTFAGTLDEIGGGVMGRMFSAFIFLLLCSNIGSIVIFRTIGWDGMGLMTDDWLIGRTGRHRITDVPGLLAVGDSLFSDSVSSVMLASLTFGTNGSELRTLLLSESSTIISSEESDSADSDLILDLGVSIGSSSINP